MCTLIYIMYILYCLYKEKLEKIKCWVILDRALYTQSSTTIFYPICAICLSINRLNNLSPFWVFPAYYRESTAFFADLLLIFILTVFHLFAFIYYKDWKKKITTTPPPTQVKRMKDEKSFVQPTCLKQYSLSSSSQI